MINKLVAILVTFYAVHCIAAETSVSPLHVGESICSPTNCYTILQELGEGFFGNVYAVSDPSGYLYAMKHYKHYNNPDFANISIADPQREYLNEQRFNHPNIIKSSEWFTSSQSGPDGAFLL